MHESPAFLRMKAEGKQSKAPIRDSFTNWSNLKVVLIALFSINGGQAVTFYLSQFYVMFFLTQTLKLDPVLANNLLIVSVILGAPFFVIAGWLSDKVGRKPILDPLRQPADLPGQPAGTHRGRSRSGHLHLPVRPGGQGALRQSL
jgi:hypothetical protein